MRKAPRQRRSQAMVALIVEAATRVLARTGWAEFTTNEVARIAGVSVGSLYQYFPNKLALAEAIRRQHLDAVLAALGRSIGLEDAGEGREPMGLSDRIAALIDGIVAAHLVNPTLHRILLDEVPLSGRADHGAFERRYSDLYQAIAAQALGPGSARTRVVGAVLASAVEGVVHDASRRGELASPEIRRELQMLVHAYLVG